MICSNVAKKSLTRQKKKLQRNWMRQGNPTRRKSQKRRVSRFEHFRANHHPLIENHISNWFVGIIQSDPGLFFSHCALLCYRELRVSHYPPLTIHLLEDV